MPRATDGTKRSRRRKKVLKHNKGYWGRQKSCIRVAKDAMRKAGQHAYRNRKEKKGDFRSLWIARISAATRAQDMTYSRFIEGLKKANVMVNRKALSNMAIEDANSFKALVDLSKKTLSA